jgi:hypothetical protein
MPFIIKTRELDAAAYAAIAARAVEVFINPPRLLKNDIEYKFDALDIYLYVDAARFNEGTLLEALCEEGDRRAGEISTRTVLLRGDCGFREYGRAPAAQTAANSKTPGLFGVITTGKRPKSVFSVTIVSQSFVETSPEDTLKSVAGIYVDMADAICDLPAGKVEPSIIRREEYLGENVKVPPVDIYDNMTIAVEHFAPEMIGAKKFSYFTGIAGIAQHTGEIARSYFGSSKKLHINTAWRNEYMFLGLLNMGSRGIPTFPTEVIAMPPDYDRRMVSAECKCKTYGVRFITWKLPIVYDEVPREGMLECSWCFKRRHNVVVAEIPAPHDDFADAIATHLRGIDPTPSGLEYIDIVNDLIGAPIVDDCGLFLKGKKWIYHPSGFNALSQGVASRHPGYFWV